MVDIKLLFAVAKGVPVVSADWVLASVSAGRWVEHSEHAAMRTHPRATRQLAGKRFHVLSHGDAMGRATLEQLISAAGGALVGKRAATHLVVSRRLSRGGAGEEEAEGGGAECVDEKWVFDAVMGVGDGEEGGEESDESEQF